MWLGGHALVAYTVANLLSFRDHQRIGSLVLGSCLPDVSYCHYVLVPRQSISAQRPWWTHSLIVAPGWGMISSLLCSCSLRYWREGLLGWLTHLMLDSLVYRHFGVRWLGPISKKPFGCKVYDSTSLTSELVVTVSVLVICLATESRSAGDTDKHC